MQLLLSEISDDTPRVANCLTVDDNIAISFAINCHFCM